MRYCQNCGNEVREYQEVCYKCGAKIKNIDKMSVDACFVLGFCLSVLGLICAIILGTKGGIKAAICGFICSLIISVAIVCILYFILKNELNHYF